jgi:hypothetical protein
MKILLIIILFIISLSSVFAQRIPKDEYIKYVPIKYPPLVRQEAGSAKLILYGIETHPTTRILIPLMALMISVLIIY